MEFNYTGKWNLVKRGWVVEKGCYRIGENGNILENEQPCSTIP
jgi:hypothetical protein